MYILCQHSREYTSRCTAYQMYSITLNTYHEMGNHHKILQATMRPTTSHALFMYLTFKSHLTVRPHRKV